MRDNQNDVTLIHSTRKCYLFRVLDIYVQLLKCNLENIDTIFVGFAPQLVLPLWRKHWRNRKIVIDFFISVYDTYVNDRKKVNPDSLLARIMHYIDVRTLEQADVIIADTIAHADYFISEFHADSDRLRIYYLQADPTIYYPRKVEKPALLRQKYVVLYFGSILPLQGVDTVLKAYDYLKDDDRFYFYMIGKISDKYEKPVSPNIEYIDWLNQEELADFISIADLCLAGHFNAEIEKADRTIPGKAYIYAAMSKNMILGDTHANRELFPESSSVSFVKRGDWKGLAETICCQMEKDK
ncbi:MAG: group 1 glycosyl transferase [Lachnospiraceae bacterium]|nr:group 1 glycosyl transferase [Lachnospiraceae bacterium]